ncbi:hypothetical protein RND81_07G188000 [Saponaria officinalis]|uniref:Retrotransposon Copia-like N-terminal domain-containing protein n=1 Tax=Saponaria officinalis TaxID=3572 RepID=A0AAW1JTQ1_SAPOF
MSEIPSDSSVRAVNPYALLDDPLYLSPSDQPTLQIVSYHFNGDNFVQWKRDVYFALVAKNKEGFLDGSCKLPPKTDKTHQQWIRCDLLVMKWILNSVEKKIRDTVQYVSSSKELWTEIIDRYGQANSLEIYQLKKDLGAIQQEHMSLVEYYGKFKRIWEHVDTLDPIPLCTCGAVDSCTCSLLKRLLERETCAKLIQFLMGLSDDYENVKTHILTMDPLPPMNKTLALLQKIEKQKQLHDVAELSTDSMAFTSLTSKDTSSGWKKARTEVSAAGNSVTKECSYCHNLGHLKSECFKLKECGYCGRKGHARENCFKLKYGSPAKLGRANTKSSYKDRSNSASYKRTVHSVDVVHSDDIISDPLSEDVPVASLAGHDASASYDPQFVEGIVSTVMDQVMKAFSEKSSGFSSVNFAGPFK